MKLSYLYTEQINLTENIIDQFKQRWVSRKNPTQIAVDKAFDAVVRTKPIMDLDDEGRRSIQNKLKAYKATLVKALGAKRAGLPQLAQDMMAKRAARYVLQLGKASEDPNSIYKSLDLKRSWATH